MKQWALAGTAIHECSGLFRLFAWRTVMDGFRQSHTRTHISIALILNPNATRLQMATRTMVSVAVKSTCQPSSRQFWRNTLGPAKPKTLYNLRRHCNSAAHFGDRKSPTSSKAPMLRLTRKAYGIFRCSTAASSCFKESIQWWPLHWPLVLWVITWLGVRKSGSCAHTFSS